MSSYAINRNTGTAVFRQISHILASEIKEIYKPGDLLPPEHELAKRFDVNRHTLRRAAAELIGEGLLLRSHGRGTIVLEQPIDYPIGQSTRFTETLENQGKSADSRVLRKLVVPVREGMAESLRLQKGEQVILIETLRSVDAAPFCIVSHFIPLAGFGKIFESYDGGSLHQFIFDNFGVRLLRKESVITAALPEGNDSEHLKMSPAKPILRVKSVNVDRATEIPLEYAVSRFRFDRVQLSVKP
jgi:GntR family phosphonate transport system transcriptional regulator